MIDIAIIGGGIAAAAAARTLAGSPLSIAIIAPRAIAGPRIGESLPHSAGPILRQLGVWEEFVAQRHRRANASFSAWGDDRLIERNAAFERGEPGWIVDRERFEALLWPRPLPSGSRCIEARLLTARRLDVKRPAASWSLELEGGQALDARFVIDASGRAASFARRRVERRRTSRLIAAYAFLEQIDAGVTPTPAVMIEARPEGWWYSSLSPSSQLILAFFTDADLLPKEVGRSRARWQQTVLTAAYTARRVHTAGFEIAAPPRITDAGMLRLASFVGDGWAAAGDAALAMDPIAAHGMTTALWSGRRAALAAARALEGDANDLEHYAQDLEHGHALYAQQLPEVYAQETRFAGAEFWRRRNGAIAGSAAQ